MTSPKRIILIILILLSACLIADAQQRKPRKTRRSSSTRLKKGDKAPTFDLRKLTGAGTNDISKVSLKQATKDRPAALIFSSFT